MGKRKARKKPPPNLKRALNVLPKSFDCPFCLSSGSVQVTIKREAGGEGLSRLKCTNPACDVKYQSKNPPTALTAAVDIFNEWIEAAAEEEDKGRG
jgi:transcription elongation factor Elf1